MERDLTPPAAPPSDASQTFPTAVAELMAMGQDVLADLLLRRFEEDEHPPLIVRDVSPPAE